jgi:hypothetical protein
MMVLSETILYRDKLEWESCKVETTSESSGT